jgi:hypothetical protein
MFLVLGKRWLVLVEPEEDHKMRGVACSVTPLLFTDILIEPSAPRFVYIKLLLSAHNNGEHIFRVLHILVSSRSPIGLAVRKPPSSMKSGDRPYPPIWDVCVVFSSDTVTAQVGGEYIYIYVFSLLW